VRAVSVHPGVVRTELGRHMTPEIIQQLVPGGGGVAALNFKSIGQGAATSLWCAVMAPADAVGGHYCEDCQVAEIVDDPNLRRGVRPYALDPARADALWAKSESMVGERF
jgi:hypothetical protein